MAYRLATRSYFALFIFTLILLVLVLQLILPGGSVTSVALAEASEVVPYARGPLDVETTMSPTATTTTPTSTPTATPARSMDACQQLLDDPEFWQYQGGWQKSGPASVGISSYGDWVSEPTIGLMPLRPNQPGISALFQTVALPANGYLYLRVHTKLKPETFNDTGSLQTGQVKIHNADGSTVLTTLGEFPTAHDWTLRTYNLSTYAGNSVQVWFGGTVDAEATATFFQIDDAYLYHCAEDIFASQLIHLPIIRNEVPTPAPTPTPVPTEIPTPEEPLPAPDTLQGGPLDLAEQAESTWYLFPSGQVKTATVAEPFPLPPSIQVRALANSNSGIFVATDQGIYQRDATFRWRRINDTPAHQIGSMFNSIWIAPDAYPDQVWVSTDGGATWQDDSAGLQGNVVSAVEAGSLGQQVLTLREGRYVLWERTPDHEEWLELAIVPGQAVAYTPGGIPGGLVYRFLAMGLESRVGSSDGNLYRLQRYDNADPEWEAIHNFGENILPLVLDLDWVSGINLESGEIQLYRWQGGLDEGEWVAISFPDSDLPDGASLDFKRIYGQSTPLQVGFAGMALSHDGELYRYDMEIEGEEPVWAWRLVTETPERTGFIVAQQQSDAVGILYSGAQLQWDDGNCTAESDSFYRSDDKGLTWTEVVSDTARQPVTSLFGQSQFVLTATCAGPGLSEDGGATWRSPADLNWPLATGAQHLALYTLEGMAIFAAGEGENGESFLYWATYDAETGAVGTWSAITPAGLGTPQALFVYPGEEPETIGIYLADETGVWLSADKGTTWKQRAGNLNGASVRALYPYMNPALREEGMLLATDQGLFFGPMAGQEGPWIPTGYPYTTEPVDFQAIFPWSVYLNGTDVVFRLPLNLFGYINPEE
jgi:hypothetical protein